MVKVLRSDWLTQGPQVKKFENKLAKYCGARFAVVVNNGTAALHLAYLAAGIGKRDEVITSPNTFVATTNMLLAIGAKPVFCDIRKDTRNIDEKKISKLINSRTKAIVPVHFAGQPCEMNTIWRIAKKHHLLVIEDACHALGARYYGNKIGGGKSAMAVFSFHPVKSITTGEGGAIVTNSRKLYDKLIRLRSHGIVKDASGKNVMMELGYNYRLTDMQAALGASQLDHLDDFVAARRRVVRWYEKELGRVKDLDLPRIVSKSLSAWHLYVICVKNPAIRKKLKIFLLKNGIGVNFHYPAAYSHPYYRANGYAKTFLPIVDDYQNTCITLPCYPDLKQIEVRRVSRLIKNYLNNPS